MFWSWEETAAERISIVQGRSSLLILTFQTGLSVVCTVILLNLILMGGGRRPPIRGGAPHSTTNKLELTRNKLVLEYNLDNVIVNHLPS